MCGSSTITVPPLAWFACTARWSADWTWYWKSRSIVVTTLVTSSLAIGLLVVAGYQSLWYALATAAAFALVMVARRASAGRQHSAPADPG